MSVWILLVNAALFAPGLRHRLVRLHHHHPELQASGRDHLLLPEPVRVGLLHHAPDGGHDRVSAGPARWLRESQLRRAPHRGHGVLRLVHLRLHGFPRRQPAAKPQSSGGVPGVPVLLCDRVDGPDVLAIAVEMTLMTGVELSKRQTPESAFERLLTPTRAMRLMGHQIVPSCAAGG